MKDITETVNRKYLPVAALVAYRAEDDPPYASNDRKYYLETRPVLKDGRLGAARPVSAAFLRDLCRAVRIAGEMTPHGTMPSNMLYADSRVGFERYIWWEPPQKRSLFFTGRVEMQDRTYHMPGIVYVATNRRLKVYAFKGKRPSPATRLLYGPYFNYYDDCSVCLGSAKVDWPHDITWSAVQEHWQKIFWGSANSHMIFNPMKEGCNLVLAIKAHEDKPFDTDRLLETRYTLRDILDGRDGKNSYR